MNLAIYYFIYRFPLIWDFGTLDDDSEKKYITQMVQKSVIGQTYPEQSGFIVNVLNQSQNFMRSRHDECSFVSLRDVERALVVFTWFSNQAGILEQVKLRLNEEEELSNFTLSIVLALGVDCVLNFKIALIHTRWRF